MKTSQSVNGTKISTPKTLPEVWPFPTSAPTPLTEKQLRQIAYDEAEEALL